MNELGPTFRSERVPANPEVEACVRMAAALLGYSVFTYPEFIGLFKHQGTLALAQLLSNPDNVITASNWPDALASLSRLKARDS